VEAIMQKNVRRLLIAAALSVSGFVITITWYKLTENISDSSKNKPIARIVTKHNEVQRKLIQKLIWQPVGENEILHIGEAIRTAADSEATIQFLGTTTRIDLDPDSAIILEESAGKIALNFLQGNLFVRGGKDTSDDTASGDAGERGTASEITLLSGNKKINVGTSEMSLGKSVSGELDLQVLKGQAQIQQDGKTVTVDQGKSLNGQTFKLLAPSPDEMIYIDKAKNEKVSFKWAPLSEDYTVTLEIGPTRNAIKPVAGIIGSGTSGALEAPVKFGRNFYRLVARSTDTAKPELATVVYKNEVVAITPPVLLEPEKDKKVVVNFESPQIQFRWSNPSQHEKVVFEMYRDSEMKQKMFNKVLTDKNEISLDIKSNAQFYWRVAGQLKGRGELIYSDLQSFSTEVFKGLATPQLDKPMAGEKIPADNTGSATVSLAWQPVTRAKIYKVTLQPESDVPSSVSSAKALTFESEIPQFRTTALKAGTYSWTVNAIDDQGKASLPADKRTFEIVNLPIIQWADDFTPSTQYVTLKPTTELKWQTSPVNFKNYRVHVVQDEGLIDPINQLTQGLKLQLELPKSGDYFVEIEALDSSNKVVARSARKKLEVQPAPLLPPPQFAKNVPARMTASNSGGALLDWEKVDGATQYMVTVKNKEGVATRELAFTNDGAELRGLMPGEYNVTLKSIDKHGRSGPESEPRSLSVPATSGVRAPKLRGVKVK
jgi:hypothetical protein